MLFRLYQWDLTWAMEWKQGCVFFIYMDISGQWIKYSTIGKWKILFQCPRSLNECGKYMEYVDLIDYNKKMDALLLLKFVSKNGTDNVSLWYWISCWSMGMLHGICFSNQWHYVEKSGKFWLESLCCRNNVELDKALFYPFVSLLGQFVVQL